MATMAGGSSSTARRAHLMWYLTRHGSVSTARASRIVGADKRTVLRDLKALAASHIPIRQEGEDREQHWILPEDWRAAGMEVGLREWLSLLLGREILGSFLHDTSFADSLAHLEEQVEVLHDSSDLDSAPSPPPRRFREDELLRRFHFIHEPARDYSEHRETLEAIVRALLGSYSVSFEYERGSSRAGTALESHRQVEPYTLVVYKRAVYLYAERRGELRPFAVERIRELVGHPDRPFPYPRRCEYDPSRALAGLFGIARNGRPPLPVRLRFLPRVRTYVEARHWYPGQRLEEGPDGALDLLFTATGNELVSLALQFGETCEVLEPAWLRAEVRRELEGALRAYTDP